MLKIRCRHCTQGMGVPDSFAGRRVRCPHCNCIVKVPQDDSGSSAAKRPQEGMAHRFSDYLKTSKAAVTMSVLVMLFGLFWLLSELNILPPFTWIWTLGLAVTGLLSMWFGGINQRTLVIGPFLIVCAVFSVLRQNKMIEIKVEIPSLVIAFGAISLAVILLGYTQPDILEEED